jgi:hypothetical protein
MVTQTTVNLINSKNLTFLPAGFLGAAACSFFWVARIFLLVAICPARFNTTSYGLRRIITRLFFNGFFFRILLFFSILKAEKTKICDNAFWLQLEVIISSMQIPLSEALLWKIMRTGLSNYFRIFRGLHSIVPTTNFTSSSTGGWR